MKNDTQRLTVKENPVLIWSTQTNKFALVAHSLGTAMLTVGNTEGFNRLTSTFRPKEIRIEQIRSGLCAIKLHFVGLVLTHESGRVEAKKLALTLQKLTGSRLFNVKESGRVIETTPEKMYARK